MAEIDFIFKHIAGKKVIKLTHSVLILLVKVCGKFNFDVVNLNVFDAKGS
jgi:hypothetical protein